MLYMHLVSSLCYLASYVTQILGYTILVGFLLTVGICVSDMYCISYTYSCNMAGYCSATVSDTCRICGYKYLDTPF
jgi:hypothetical protein